MTVKDIYDVALARLSESLGEGDNEDYAERVPYIVASFCSQLAGTDKAMRELEGEDEAKEFSPVYLPLESEFPLLDAMSAPASLYLAAMLVIDYDPELYDRLFEHYCDAVSEICTSVRGVCESTVNKYFKD